MMLQLKTKKMKKHVSTIFGVILVCGTIMLFACNKNSIYDYKCTYVAPTDSASAAEIASLQSYLDSKGITNAIQHPNGFFYTIQTEGTGRKPTVCSSVTVVYRGKLVDDTQFDSNTGGTTFTLGGLVKGWQLGLPLIGTGGKITLYIPPSLGYGSSGSGIIPPNANLIFDIQILGISN